MTASRLPHTAYAFAAVLVLTSCAMVTEISPALRSELAPTGKLRVGINYGNFLLPMLYTTPSFFKAATSAFESPSISP